MQGRHETQVQSGSGRSLPGEFPRQEPGGLQFTGTQESDLGLKLLIMCTHTHIYIHTFFF